MLFAPSGPSQQGCPHVLILTCRPIILKHLILRAPAHSVHLASSCQLRLYIYPGENKRWEPPSQTCKLKGQMLCNVNIEFPFNTSLHASSHLLRAIFHEVSSLSPYIPFSDPYPLANIASSIAWESRLLMALEYKYSRYTLLSLFFLFFSL